MVNERRIWCCGASSWTRVIAWLQIIGNLLMLLFTFVDIVYDANIKRENIVNKGVITTEFALTSVVSFFGFAMGVLLLKGTKQKRVSYIRAWLIYGVIYSVISIISVIFIAAITPGATAPLSVWIFSVILITGINLFCLIVVYLHIKEINEGVNIP